MLPSMKVLVEDTVYISQGDMLISVGGVDQGGWYLTVSRSKIVVVQPIGSL